MGDVSRPAPNPASRDGPYVGPRPFRHDDHGRFFGRTREVRELAGLWRRHRLTILHGDSGVGKTSLLQAGVVPHLTPSTAGPPPIGHTGYRVTSPRATLVEENPYTFALLSSWLPHEPPARVSGLSIGDFLRRWERRSRGSAPTLVAIDQFEQVLVNGPPDQHRHGFLRGLADALADHPRAHLLVCVRTDHLDVMREVAKVLGASEAFASFSLGPLDREAAVEAVTRPLRLTGRTFEPGVAGLLVDDLRTVRVSDTADEEITRDVEPVLLQVACEALWERLTERERLIAAERIPDLDQALTGFCERALASAAADHEVHAVTLGRWLRDAFVTPPGGEATVRAGAEETLGMADCVVRAIEDRHLVKARVRDGVRWYELQHRRLIRPIRDLDGSRIAVGAFDPAAHLRAAEHAVSLGELTLARRLARAAGRSEGRAGLRVRAEAESLLGDVAYRQGRPEAAIRHYREAASVFETLQLGPAVGRLLGAIGRLLLTRGEQAAAIDALRAAASRAPDDLTVQTGLGQALWHSGQVKAALAVLDGVLARDGDTPEALRIRGEILTDIGEAKASLRDLDRLDRRARPSARAARALSLATLSRRAAALAELDGILGEAADSGPVLLRMAQVERLGGEIGSAAELASRAISATDPPLSAHQRTQAKTLLNELRPTP